MSYETSVPFEARNALNDWHNRDVTGDIGFAGAAAPELSMIVPISVSAVDAKPETALAPGPDGYDFATDLGVERLVRDYDPATRTTVFADGPLSVEAHGRMAPIPRGSARIGQTATDGVFRPRE